MKKLFTTSFATVSAFAFTTVQASAQDSGGWFSRLASSFWEHPEAQYLPRSEVPEIDASTGLMALAAVGAALLLAHEVNRRRKA